MTDKELRLECLRLACAQRVEDPVRVAREMYDWVRGGSSDAGVSFCDWLIDEAQKDLDAMPATRVNAAGRMEYFINGAWRDQAYYAAMLAERHEESK